MNEEEAPAVKVSRSPSHPYFDLESAIARAQQLYQVDGLAWTSLTIASEHCGLSPTSSSAARYLSTLLQFGLLEEKREGAHRQFRLSGLAKSVLLNPDVKEKAAAIRQAALSPSIYDRLWSHWEGSLPSDAKMRYDLETTFDFNRKALDGVIADLRSTIAYAGLDRPEPEPVTDKPVASEHSSSITAPSQAVPSGVTHPVQSVATPTLAHGPAGTRPLDITIPFMNGGQAVLTIPIPMSEGDYALLKALLEANLTGMKPAIVPGSIAPPSAAAAPSLMEAPSSLKSEVAPQAASEPSLFAIPSHHYGQAVTGQPGEVS